MIKNFNEFEKYLKEQNPFKEKYFAWNGKRYFDAFQFITFMPIHLIICVDYGIDTEKYENKFKILSIEKERKKRREWHHISEETFQGKFGEKLKKFILSLGKKVYLLTYHSSKDIEKFISENPDKIELLGPKIEMKDYLDCKTTLPRDLTRIGVIPNLEKITDIQELDFISSKEKYGIPFILQWGIGDSGSGTFFVKTREEFNRLKNEIPQQEVKIAKYIKGYSIAICAVVYRDSVVLSQPNIQVCGQPECVSKSTTYCATDFTAANEFTNKRMSHIYDYTLKIGKWMKSKGYRGLFGIDFITTEDPDNIYVCEVNARFTGEGRFYSFYQKREGYVPLQFFHLAEYLNIDIPRDEIETYNNSLKPLKGSCITLHNILPSDIKVGENLRPGIYKIKDGKLKYLRDGISLLCLKDEDEFVIGCAVPPKGEIIEPDASILRIQTYKSVFETKTKRFYSWVRDLIHIVRKELDLTPV